MPRPPSPLQLENESAIRRLNAAMVDFDLPKDHSEFSLQQKEGSNDIIAVVNLGWAVPGLASKVASALTNAGIKTHPGKIGNNYVAWMPESSLRAVNGLTIAKLRMNAKASLLAIDALCHMPRAEEKNFGPEM